MESLPTEKITWFQQQIIAWATENRRDFPWRRTQDAYAVLVAECLLQKTGAQQAVAVYETILATYPTIESLAAADLEELTNLLQPLGLAFRAPRLQQAAVKVRDRWDGQIPSTETELLELPGVGNYVARSILANAYCQPVAVLDTNVARILERFFGIQGERVKSRCKKLWHVAEQVAPETEVGHWNLSVMDFGALVCTAKNPACGSCPLQEQCCAWQKSPEKAIAPPPPASR
ncbi:A/G-specific adenine glycosylase [Geitlerinema sp. PCC 9228]|uniref:A/G-specific adenine glycosylase n=1 Tax=Geitlerinema sp. PCC 9228 TaxID=111611 RepID=UPI0008F9B82B|nr:A/G-specific adenine glycosylase [Geitlerinema sp. PCC 9228]